MQELGLHGTLEVAEFILPLETSCPLQPAGLCSLAGLFLFFFFFPPCFFILREGGGGGEHKLERERESPKQRRAPCGA